MQSTFTVALLLLLTESLVVNSWLRYFKYVQLIFSSGSVILKYKSECIWETFPKYIHQEPSQTYWLISKGTCWRSQVTLTCTPG